jgi:hypothetical protein
MIPQFPVLWDHFHGNGFFCVQPALELGKWGEMGEKKILFTRIIKLILLQKLNYITL